MNSENNGDDLTSYRDEEIVHSDPTQDRSERDEETTSCSPSQDFHASGLRQKRLIRSSDFESNPSETSTQVDREPILGVSDWSAELDVPPDDWLGAEQYYPLLASLLFTLIAAVGLIASKFERLSLLFYYLIIFTTVTLLHSALRLRHAKLARNEFGDSKILLYPCAILIFASVYASLHTKLSFQLNQFWPATAECLYAIAFSLPFAIAIVVMMMAPKKTKFKYNRREKYWHLHESQLFSGGTAYGGTYSQIKNIVITLRMKRPRSRYSIANENMGWRKDKWEALLGKTLVSIAEIESEVAAKKRDLDPSSQSVLQDAKAAVLFIQDGVRNNYVRPNDRWPWMNYVRDAVNRLGHYAASDSLKEQVAGFRAQIAIRRTARLLRWFWLHEAVLFYITSLGKRNKIRSRAIPARVIPTVVLYAVVDRDPDQPLEIRHYSVLSKAEANALQFVGQRYESLRDALTAATVDALDLGVEFFVEGRNANDDVVDWKTKIAEAFGTIPSCTDNQGYVASTSRRRAIIKASHDFLGRWIDNALQAERTRKSGLVSSLGPSDTLIDLESCKRQFRIVLNNPHTVLGVHSPIEDSSQLHPFLKYVILRFTSRALRADSSQMTSQVGEQVQGSQGKSSKFIGQGLKLASVSSGALMMAMFSSGIYTLYVGAAKFGGFIKFKRDDLKGSDEESYLIVNGLHALEIIILAPLPYLLILGLTRYVNALSRNKDAKKAKAELLDFKAFEVALLISVMAAFILSVFIQSSAGKDMPALLRSPSTLAILAVILVIMVGYYALLEYFADKQGAEARANPTDIVPFVFEAEQLSRQERYRESAEMYDQAAFFIMANSVQSDAKALYYDGLADLCRLILARESSDYGLERIACAGFTTHLMELHDMELSSSRKPWTAAPTHQSKRHFQLPFLSSNHSQSNDNQSSVAPPGRPVLSQGLIAFAMQHKIGVESSDPLKKVFALLTPHEVLDALSGKNWTGMPADDTTATSN